MPSQPLIRNYGLFWKAEDIFWGAGSNPGTLLGLLAWNITSDAVDFRDQRGVYVLYADYDLVYVGQNNGQQLLGRLKQHRKDDLSERWNRFSWFGIRAVKANGELAQYNQAAHVPNRDVLNHIEAIRRAPAKSPRRKIRRQRPTILTEARSAFRPLGEGDAAEDLQDPRRIETSDQNFF